MPLSLFRLSLGSFSAAGVQLTRTWKTLLLVLSVMGLAVSGAGQTQVNLAKQGKNADFSEFVTTRPWKLVTTLPGSCQLGEAVFLTTAIFGQQLHFCSVDNSWTLYSTTPIQAVDLLDFAPLKTGAQQLTAGPFCSVGRPCRARFGGKLLSMTGPAVVTLSGVSSTGTLFLWLDQQGLRVGTSAGSGVVSCNMMCSTSPTPMVTFPAGSLPIGAVPYVSNVFALVSGAMDQRAILSSQRVEAGPSANLVVTSNSITGASEVDLSDTIDVGGFTATRMLKRGTAVTRPVSCHVGDLYHQTDQSAGIYLCNALNQWQGPMVRRDEIAPVEVRSTSTGVTGDAAPITLVAAGHAPGAYRICGVVTVTTGAAESPLDLSLSWRSPATGADQAQILLSAPVSATGEGAACRLVRTTGASAIVVDPSIAGAAVYTLTLTAERLL